MKKVFFALLALLGTLTVKAQLENPVKWSYGSKRISATEAVIFIKAQIDDKWHIYSQNMKDGGPIRTSFTFLPSKSYTLVGKTIEPKPISKFEPLFKMNVGYFENEVTFQQKVKLRSAAPATVSGKLEFGVCDDKRCLPPDEVSFSVAIKAPGK